MKGISLFGGTGFIGKYFLNAFDGPHDGVSMNAHIYVRERWNRRPVVGTDTLWLISTTHNYNVLEDATLDVKTNLITLTEALESHRLNNPDGVFNFVSSWFVYGDLRGQPAHENNPCNPKGFYSITKKCAEDLLISYCTTFNMKYRIFRLCNVVGHGDKFSSKKNAFQYLIDEMKQQKPIDIYGDGRFYRNIMHVYDVCKAIRLLMMHGKLNTIYNVGHPEHRHFIDHIYYIRDRIGYTGEINFIEPKEFHQQVQTPSFRMDTTRLVTDTGFQPYYNLDAMLDDLTSYK